MRRFFPHRWPYLYRQGLANLYRPANQTVTVVLSLGFGAFLLSTLFLVQHNLLRDLRVGGPGERPNIVFFDIQADQRAAAWRGDPGGGDDADSPSVPIVPMRIRSVKGVPVKYAPAGQRRSRRPTRAANVAGAGPSGASTAPPTGTPWCRPRSCSKGNGGTAR